MYCLAEAYFHRGGSPAAGRAHRAPQVRGLRARAGERDSAESGPLDWVLGPDRSRHPCGADGVQGRHRPEGTSTDRFVTIVVKGVALRLPSFEPDARNIIFYPER